MALLTVAGGSGATMMPSDSVHVQRLDPILADPRIEFAGLPPVIPMWVSPSCLSKRKRAASPLFSWRYAMRLRTCVIHVCGVIVGIGYTVNAHSQDHLINEAKAIIQRAIDAQGGREKLVQFERANLRTASNVQGTFVFMETWRDLRKRLQKQLVRYDQGGKKNVLIRVINENGLWEKNNEAETTKRDDAVFNVALDGLTTFHASLLFPLLDDKAYNLSYRGDFKIEGQLAQCIRVIKDKRPATDFFFDKATGLLVKQSTKDASTQMRGKVAEALFAEFRQLSGAKIATKTELRLDDHLLSEDYLIEIRPIAEFPKDTFAKP
jgi:hypothetical protein